MPRTADYKHVVTGEIQTRQESVAGSGNFDTVIPTPSGRTEGTFGVQPVVAYEPEDVAVYSPEQFGLGLYYSRKFRFSNEWNPNLALSVLRQLGHSAFTARSLTSGEVATLSNEEILYVTESNWGNYEGALGYQAAIQDYFNRAFSAVPIPTSRAKYLVFNFETSNEWWPGNSGSTYPGFSFGGTYNTSHAPSWDSQKGLSIAMEATQETITLETLANRGQSAWENEMRTRRANRLVLNMQLARQRADAVGCLVSYGASGIQGIPSMSPGHNYVYDTNMFNEGSANGASFGADVNGYKTFNGSTTIRFYGNQYDYETVHWNYDYPDSFKILQSDFDEIWNGSDVSKKTHRYLNSKIIPTHVGAYVKARNQGNVYRMLNRNGFNKKRIPMVHMVELLYEGSKAEKINSSGGFVALVEVRVPDPALHNSIVIKPGEPGQYLDTPKVWITPGEMFTRKLFHRFMEADEDGAGFHIFEDKTRFRFEVLTDQWSKMYQHEVHTATALIQARKALQALELMFEEANTYVENPHVKVDGGSSFSNYDGATALAYDGQGTYGTQKPAYVLRYWDRSTYWDVVIIGSMKQATATTTRIDTVKVDGALNGNSFECKLRGHWGHMFRFVVPKTTSNTLFSATAQNTQELPGYAGKIVS